MSCDEESVGACKTDGGAKGETCGVGATSFSEKASVSPAGATSGDCGAMGTGGATPTLDDITSSVPISEESMIGREFEDMTLK